jgi:hypothetical protein
MMGYQQNAPATVDTSVGFDVLVENITVTDFDVEHNIFGGDISYLHYMYLAYVRTDYESNFYTQQLNVQQATKQYSFDVSYNAGESYPNFPTDPIGQKGFLVGYKIKQGTANGFFLNFTLTPKDSTSFTIQIGTNDGSELEFIQYYRLGYDQSAIERETYQNYFKDVVFESIQGVNTNTANNAWFTA